MGVHDTARYLDQLPDVSDQHQTLIPGFCRHIDGIADEIAAFHNVCFFYAIALLQKIQSIISRGQDQVPFPFCVFHLHLQTDGVQKRLFAHGLYPSAGAKNGQAALDTKPWIKCPLCQLLSLRNGDHSLKTTLISGLLRGV